MFGFRVLEKSLRPTRCAHRPSSEGEVKSSQCQLALSFAKRVGHSAGSPEQLADETQVSTAGWCHTRYKIKHFSIFQAVISDLLHGLIFIEVYRQNTLVDDRGAGKGNRTGLFLADIVEGLGTVCLVLGGRRGSKLQQDLFT